jgi:hypothetical protein
VRRKAVSERHHKLVDTGPGVAEPFLAETQLLGRIGTQKQ